MGRAARPRISSNAPTIGEADPGEIDKSPKRASENDRVLGDFNENVVAFYTGVVCQANKYRNGQKVDQWNDEDDADGC